ncbi:Ubiquinol oxidase 2, mitochondrial [Capsicum annuum]|nr:Ubiquinol oxidase 2, mitochondrial [Capsicum annuum]
MELPLLKEDIPPDDEGRLFLGCDCKVYCIDLLNNLQGKDLFVADSWEKVYPKDAAATSGEKLDDISRLPSDDLKNGLPDIPCPNEVYAMHLSEEISSLENDLVLLGNNSGLTKEVGLCFLNGFQNMTHLEYDSECTLYLENYISVQRKEMPEVANADKLSVLELENACDEQRENATQSDELPLLSSSSTEEKLKVGGMSTFESRSSGKRKAYGEVTTKRICKSFKGNNYPYCDAKEKFEQSGGWIKALPKEAENERMHLMTMTCQADLSIDLSKYHVPKKFLDKVAYWSVKLLRIPTDLFFKERYGCRAMMLETVAGVLGMVGGNAKKERPTPQQRKRNKSQQSSRLDLKSPTTLEEYPIEKDQLLHRPSIPRKKNMNVT